MSLPPQKNGNNGRMTPAGIEPASQPWKGRITNQLDHGAMRGSIAVTLYIFERLLMLHRISHAAERLGFEPKFVVLETTVLPLTLSFYFPGHAGYGVDGNRTRVQN